MTTTRRRTALLLAAAALGAAACSGPAASSTGTTSAGTGAHPGSSTTSTTEAPPLAAGQVGTRTQIPWGSVGNGWYVATWSTAVPRSPGPGPTTLAPAPVSVFLVDPEGGRYLIATLPAGSDDLPESWSGDARRVLFWTPAGPSELDVATGALAAAIPLPGGAQASHDQYTLPKGTAILRETATFSSGRTDDSLSRYALSGQLQLTYPTSFSKAGAFTGGYLESRDGTTILMQAKAGIAVVGNDGTVESQLTGQGYAGCAPVRWWTGTQFVARCTAPSEGIPTLSILDTSGGAPLPVTTLPTAQWDSGDLDAWNLDGTTFVQVATGCGSLGVGTVTPSRQTVRVTIPQVPDGESTIVLGATPGALSIRSTASCGVGGMLLTYTPSSNTSDILLGGPVNGGSVLVAIAYPGIENPLAP